METIRLRCKECDGIMTIDRDREMLCCPYCGSKELFVESDDIKKERIRSRTYKDVTYAQMAHEKSMFQEKVNYQNRKSKRILVIVGVILALSVLSSIASAIRDRSGISPTASYDEYIGQDYNSVEKELKAVGFKNITVIPTNEEADKGKVVRISIDGNSMCFEFDRFPKKAKVIIVYEAD